MLGAESAVPDGRVVIISSTSAIAAEPNKSAYVAAKAGVMRLVSSSALEGGRDGIRINAVLPEWMRTEMSESQLSSAIAGGLSRAQAEEKMFARQPVKRFVGPFEVAAAVRFLLGSDSSGINGAGLPVDLGLLAQQATSSECTNVFCCPSFGMNPRCRYA